MIAPSGMRQAESVGFIRFGPFVSHDEEVYLRHFCRTQVAVLRRVRVEIRFLVGHAVQEELAVSESDLHPRQPQNAFYKDRVLFVGVGPKYGDLPARARYSGR
jgi:hypothetical protein